MNNLTGGTSGEIPKAPLKAGPSGYRIGVKSLTGYLGKSFTVADEVARIILHKDKIGDEISDDALYRNGLPSIAEAKANRLAADIFTPSHLIVTFKPQGFDPPAKMSDALLASEAAMKLGLSYL